MDDPYDSTKSTQTYWAIVKLWCTLSGLYIWEFIITLDYEWRVIRGRLPYRWTIWVYSLTRVGALLGVIFCFLSMDNTIQPHCQLWTSLTVGFFHLSATAASLLIVLRITAIWNKNKVVTGISITVWVISIAFRIISASQLRSFWDPVQHLCDPVNTRSSERTFIPTIVSNLALLLIMLAGLLILRRHEGGKSGLSLVLWKQAVIWLALAIATEVPPLVLMVLDLNNHVNVVLETPCLITMIIAATRMHRYLIDFAYRAPGFENMNPEVSKLAFARARQTNTTPTTLNQIEVTVHTATEQHLTTQKSDDHSSDMDTIEKGSPTGTTSDDHSSTISSASEHMFHIVGSPSMLDLPQASTHPLPTGSESPSLQTQLESV